MDVSDIDMFECNSNQNNLLQKNMDSISSENPTLNLIYPKMFTSTSEMIKIQEIRNAMKSVKIIYPNKDDITLIKIKDDNFLESGERIDDYIFKLENFDDNKFNTCSICRIHLNKYFCKDCNKNICDICKEAFMQSNHILIDLSKELDQISNYINNIRTIIEKCYIEPKNKKDNDDAIMKNNNSFDEYEMDNESDEKTLDYTYDIVLIEAIIDKYYKNYFHYKNIEESFNYLVRKSSINSISENLKIQNDLESGKNKINIEEDYEDERDYIIIKYKIIKGKKIIRIFGKEFSDIYKNIYYIIYRNKKYELTEYFRYIKMEYK